MVALQIRGVPEDVRQTLADRAQARGQSLQAFLLSLVEDEVRRAHNVDLLTRFTERADGSRVTAARAAEDVAAGRAERGAQLTESQAEGDDA